MLAKDRGILRWNIHKTEAKHPHYAGSINVDGKMYQLSGWLLTEGEGKVLSLSCRPEETESASQEEWPTGKGENPV